MVFACYFNIIDVLHLKYLSKEAAQFLTLKFNMFLLKEKVKFQLQQVSNKYMNLTHTFTDFLSHSLNMHYFLPEGAQTQNSFMLFRT